jgi:outer membrane protein
LKLTLPEAEQTALKNHPAAAVANYNALAARERPAQFAAAKYPAVNASLTGAGAPDNSRLAAGALNNPVIYSRLATGFSVNQLLFDFGRTSHLQESSELQASAEEERVKATRNQILLDVDRSFFEALRTEGVQRVARETVQARQLVVDQVTELERASLKSSLDRSFAEVSLAEAELLLKSAENEHKAAVANLAVAIGLPNQPSFELVDEPFAIEPVAVDELIGKALADRPDLRARALDVQAAQRFTQAERALRYPSVSATAAAGWLPGHVDALRGQYGAAGINLTFPFLNGGLYRAREREAKMRELAASEVRRDLEARIIRDVTVAALRVTNAAERVGLTGRLLAQSELALELAQTRYDLGLSSIIELSQAQLARTSAAIQNVSAKYEYQTQRSVLMFRVGRP